MSTLSLTPLTHHEILGLIEPFSRLGLRVDLAASDRAKRLLAFKPVERLEAVPDPAASSAALAPAAGTGSAAVSAFAASTQAPQPLLETLRLECPDPGTARAPYTLVRTLQHASGLQASLRATGPDAAAVLKAVEQVPPAQQFRFGEDHALALSQRVAAGGSLVMTQGQVQLPGLKLTMDVSTVVGVAGEITLTGPVANNPQLPQDLLAVQGWSWARLERRLAGLRTRVRLRGNEPRRSQVAQARLEEVAAHLARTLAAPPSQFHARHRLARWGVVFRRAIPVLTLGLMALGLWVVSQLAMDTDSGVWMLLLHVPTMMLIIGFSLQEMPQFEIPPLPKPLDIPVWPGDDWPVKLD